MTGDSSLTRTNEFGQPIGADLSGWSGAKFPTSAVMTGEYVSLQPLSPEHTTPLYEAFGAGPDSLWTYMPFGPFPYEADLSAAIDKMLSYPEWLAHAITVAAEPVGFACYLRIDPGAGSIEIGSIAFAPRLQRTSAATEAIFLLIDHAFALGYRRCEWKCDDLNEPSRRAALRFGFTYEGTFRKATHYKSRSRDTAWYAIVDSDWPSLRHGYELWLDPSNFDDSGKQRRTLEDCRAAE